MRFGKVYFSLPTLDVFEPDLRASVKINDLNGGNVVPGDILEYTIVGKNIGSDIANGVYIRDTLDPRTVYVPNSLQITYGPNTGLKTAFSFNLERNGGLKDIKFIYNK